jgi:hypothetical protein
VNQAGNVARPIGINIVAEVSSDRLGLNGVLPLDPLLLAPLLASRIEFGTLAREHSSLFGKPLFALIVAAHCRGCRSANV